MRWLRLSAAAAVVFGMTAYFLAPAAQTRRSAQALIDNVGARPSSNERAILAAQDRLNRDPGNADLNASLGLLYLQAARETGDPAFYPKAGSLFDRALRKNPASMNGAIGKATLAMARHDFGAAREIASAAIAADSRVPAIYGVLADAYIELGEYDAAVKTLERMVAMKPDLSSYTRISYMRELSGDVEGAIEAMRMAVEAGAPAAENTAWCLVQLGNLHLNTAGSAAAAGFYQDALNRFPDYVHALAGLARIAEAREDHGAAIKYYQRAIDRVPLPEFVIALGDLYERAGRQDAAREQFRLVKAMEQLYAANGVSMDLEMALFEADHDGDVQAAVEVSEREWAWRKSVRVADVYAWTLYKAGRFEDASAMMRQALRLGSKDPLFLRHARQIEAAVSGS